MVCHHCKKRTSTCHSTCPDYKAFQEEDKKKKEEAFRLKEINRNMIEYKQNVYNKYKRRHRLK